MIKKRDLTTPISEELITGVIDQGCEFEGKLCFRGSVRINGLFKGEIYTPDTLIIGEKGRVLGDVEAGSVVITGEFSGTMKAKNRIEIHKPAIFKGNIFTPSLSVDEGVLFEGKSKVSHQQLPQS